MGIYETIGLAWVILTSSLASFAIFYLAWIGSKVMLSRTQRPSITQTAKIAPSASTTIEPDLPWEKA